MKKKDLKIVFEPIVMKTENGEMIDWEKAFSQFVASKYELPTHFLRKIHGIDAKRSGSIQKNIQGWTRKKKQWQEIIEEKRREHLEGITVSKRFKEICKVAEEGEELIVTTALAKVKNSLVLDEEGKVVDSKLTPIQLRTMLEIFRLEQDKPMAINQNNNKHNINNTTLNINDLINSLKTQEKEDKPDYLEGELIENIEGDIVNLVDNNG